MTRCERQITGGPSGQPPVLLATAVLVRACYPLVVSAEQLVTWTGASIDPPRLAATQSDASQPTSAPPTTQPIPTPPVRAGSAWPLEISNGADSPQDIAKTSLDYWVWTSATISLFVTFPQAVLNTMANVRPTDPLDGRIRVTARHLSCR